MATKNLISHIFYVDLERMDYDYLFKILMVGDMGVGKTNILVRYVDDLFDNGYMSTIGVDFKIKTVTVDNKVIKLQIWDTAGHERFRTVTSAYYRGAHAVLIVFSVTDITSFRNLHFWFHDIKEKNNSGPHLGLPNLSYLLVGNKTDLDWNREVSTAQALEIAQQYSVPYIETSAKKNTNIEDAFANLIRRLMLDHISLINTKALLEAPASKPSQQCCFVL